MFTAKEKTQLIAEIASKYFESQLQQIKMWKAGDEDLEVLNNLCVGLATETVELSVKQTRFKKVK